MVLMTNNKTISSPYLSIFPDYEDAICNAISLSGDSDTMARITGGLAQAYYKTIPELVVKEVKTRLFPPTCPLFFN